MVDQLKQGWAWFVGVGMTGGGILWDQAILTFLGILVAFLTAIERYYAIQNHRKEKRLKELRLARLEEE